ncbi:MAG: hypothetical protein ACXWZM_07515, partial [Solirubrobacterales bacterium]
MSVSFGSYLLGLAELGFVLLAFGLAALALRMRLLGGWSGAPARLVEAVTGIALLIWTAELLGAVGLLREWALLLASLLVALAALLLSSRSPAGGGIAGDPPSPPVAGLAILIAVGVIGVVVAHWGFETKYALDSGIVNFDSLWYHMPFAVDMAQGGSTTALHHTDTV